MKSILVFHCLLLTASAFLISPPRSKVLSIRSDKDGAVNKLKRISRVNVSKDVDAGVSAEDGVMIRNVFDFSGDASSKSVESFERIDDAVMGGISLSALKNVDNEPFASWSGICRTDGGGFCGMRTLPFKEPLSVDGADGIYMECRLASDEEPERRVWKITLRSDTSRGEQVYQAAFQLPSGQQWASVKVPFQQFQLVRGPRLVPNGPAFNTTAGVFQIGVSLSKFIIGQNTTELENFRPGFFDLQFKRIGFYAQSQSLTLQNNDNTIVPNTLSKDELKKKKPLLLKLLLPVAKIFFSEKANRRKSAMNILTKKRGMNRFQAILFGIRSRSQSRLGVVPSLFKTCSILTIDSLRFFLRTFLRIALIYPIRILKKSFAITKQLIAKNG